MFFSFQQNMTLLEDECMTVEESGIEENQQILIEGNTLLISPFYFCNILEYLEFLLLLLFS